MDDEVRRAAERLASVRTFGEAEEAWEPLRELGAEVVPHLEAVYPLASRAPARTSIVFHVIRYARSHAAAYRLGLKALEDRSTIVRYRACGVLAYSLRREAVPALVAATKHLDKRTADHAAAAIRAIQAQNHHLFIDRDESGRSYWIVNPEDEDPARSRGHETTLLGRLGRLLGR